MPPETGKTQAAYVQDIADSAKQAVAYVRGMTFEQFWDDQKTRDAVAMRLHVMGETTKKLQLGTVAKLGLMPVEQIRGLRNRIAHDYGRVNFRIVWQTVREDLPPLISHLETYLQQHKPAGGQALRVAALPSVSIKPVRPRPSQRMGL